jgi:hypothetical protein
MRQAVTWPGGPGAHQRVPGPEPPPHVALRIRHAMGTPVRPQQTRLRQRPGIPTVGLHLPVSRTSGRQEPPRRGDLTGGRPL